MNDSSQSGDVAAIVQRLLPVQREGPSNSFCEFTKTEIEQSVAARFEKQVALYGDRLAAKSDQEEITYNALNRRANRVARAILEPCGDCDDPLALLFTYGVLPVVAVIGVFKAGKIVVTIDPTSPVARNEGLMADAGAQMVLTDSANLAQARQLAGQRPVLNIEDIGSGYDDTNLNLPISPDTVANIIYTSGSTGRPKGVICSQRNLLRNASAQGNTMHVVSEDRHGLIVDSGHVMWMAGVLMTLLYGACICPFDVKTKGMIELASWLRRQDITIYRSVATTFRTLTSTLADGAVFPTIRLVILAGETIRASDISAFRGHFGPDCLLRIAYSATETTIISRCWVNNKSQWRGDIVPAGYVTDDMEALILDDDGRAAGCNAIGEIAARSSYLTLGYWRQPELTRQRFLPDPDESSKRIYLTGDIGVMLPDGCLVPLGRKDDQVKIRGFRIEVAEVETALLRLPVVRQAAVVARPDASGEQHLVAYLVPSSQPAPTTSAIRQQLSKTLPAQLVPSAYVFLDALPLTSSGKLDRRALPHPGTARPELDVDYVAPRTPVEETLAGTWARVLGIEHVGIHDDFFDLGGDSLRAAQVMARANDGFAVNLPLSRLFESPTVAAMALLVTQAQAQQATPDEIERLLAEVEAMTDDKMSREDAGQGCKQ
jgi:amino acid adenylation domain-containing protein